MELQVMILDDEFIILDGLCSFPWHEYNCHIAATARNGIEGLQKLREQPVDLILSDVKMPGMDGLEFAAKAREIYPNVTIVILTGYDSFAYAKESIRLGVEEYLLKPVDYEALKDTVQRVTSQIRHRQGQEQRFEELNRYFERSMPQLRARFTANLLLGRFQGEKEVRAQEELLQLHIGRHIVCVGRKTMLNNHMEQREQWIEAFAYLNIFEEIFANDGIEALSDYNTATMEYSFILLFSTLLTDDECMDHAIDACQKIQQEVMRCDQVSMNFGLSEVGQDITQVNVQHRKAQRACGQCIYLGHGDNVLLKYEDLYNSVEREFVISTGERSRFMVTLFQRDFLTAENELRNMFAEAPADVDQVKFAALDLLIGCMKFPYNCMVESDIQNRDWNMSAVQSGIRKISECKDTESIVNGLTGIFATLIKQNTASADERNRKLVESILAYIRENYAQDLSMDDLTDHFHVSRTYISRLLKEYSGKRFLEYLTDVRFEHVESLMADNRYKQYEIADIVGFKDFGYYIKVFKKRYGITPNEFRKRI